MVQRKNTSILQNSPQIANYKNYFGTAVLSALTIRPFDMENTSFGYFPPIFLLSTVASLCSLLASFFMLENTQFLDFIIISFLAYFPIFILLLIAAFTYSYFGCMILGLPNEAKDFGLVASSFSSFPIVILLSFILPAMIFSLAIFATMILMNYYITSSYQRYFPMGDERTRIIYNVFGIVVFMLTIYGTVACTGASVKVSKEVLQGK